MKSITYGFFAFGDGLAIVLSIYKLLAFLENFMPTKRHSKTLVRHAETAEQLRARIIAALNSDRYKARTISGIAQAVNTGGMILAGIKLTEHFNRPPENKRTVVRYVVFFVCIVTFLPILGSIVTAMY